MDDPGQLSEYGKILIMLMIGIVAVSATIFLGTIISPKKPNPVKRSTYECGEETIGSSWNQFNPRFYVVALVFLLFDVELIFIFPWSVVFGQSDYLAAEARWGWFTLFEMGLFIAVLALGLVFVWKKGDLAWIKPRPVLPQVDVSIPATAYEKLNHAEYVVRDFRRTAATKEPDQSEKTSVPPKKVAFKPRFRKPDPS